LLDAYAASVRRNVSMSDVVDARGNDDFVGDIRPVMP
jgi:hypothetical protein